jgi:hypothetical protein
MVVGDQVAGAVGGLPVTPEGQPQAVPAHAGELRHVLVDHPLPVGVHIAGRAVVGSGVHDIVRAEERDLGPVVAPTHHTGAVEVDGAVGERGGGRALRRGRRGRALRVRRGHEDGERGGSKEDDPTLVCTHAAGSREVH